MQDTQESNLTRVQRFVANSFKIATAWSSKQVSISRKLYSGENNTETKEPEAQNQSTPNHSEIKASVQNDANFESPAKENNLNDVSYFTSEYQDSIANPSLFNSINQNDSRQFGNTLDIDFEPKSKSKTLNQT